jgi:hypothetical protein
MGRVPGQGLLNEAMEVMQKPLRVREKKFMCSRNFCVLPKPGIRRWRTCGMSHTSHTRLLPITVGPSDCNGQKSRKFNARSEA